MAKVSKRKAVVVEESSKKILSQQEQIAVQVSPLEVQNAKLLMAIEEQALKNMVLELEMLSLKIDKQKARVGTLANKYESAKAIYTGTMSDIMKNHGLPSDKFSYNTNTGEIIL
jgi:hypothetical protein